MTTKSREHLYGTSVRMSAQRAREARIEADELACIAWSQRMLGFRGPAQPSPMMGDALNAGFRYPMPDGRIIRTIGEAAEYATSLPRKVGNTEPWQRAAKVLHEAAEHGGPFVFMARIGFYRAVYGDKPPPIGDRVVSS
jgi:hypothetical protein